MFKHLNFIKYIYYFNVVFVTIEKLMFRQFLLNGVIMHASSLPSLMHTETFKL